MTRRLVRVAACAAATLLAAPAPGLSSIPEPLEVGAEAPALIPTVGPGHVVVTWAFPIEALQGCSSPASEFRRLQRRYGDRVHLVVVAVGDDPGIVDPFLRRERIRPLVRRVTEAEYARHFGPTALPAVHIIKDRVIREMVTDSTWSDGVTMSRRGIRQTTERLLE